MHWVRSLLTALLVLFPASVALGHNGNATLAAGADTDVVVDDPSARASTLSFIAAHGRFKAAAPGNRGRELAELIAVAKERHDELAALVDSNPAEFLRVLLPAGVRASLPAEVAPLVEQPADETGDLEVLHVDHVDPTKDFYMHFLNTPRGKFSLHFAGKAPALTTGDRVRVRGMKLDKAIVIAQNGVEKTQATAVAALGGTLGARKTLAILVNFQDVPTQPFTVATAQTLMFSTTSNYDYEASYQQTSLIGDVAGWFTISERSDTCNYENIAAQAKQKASAAGYSLSQYSHHVFIFPANACGWWGLGSVGGNPSMAWIHTRYGFSLPVIGHEMGHNFGLYHSHSLDCGSVPIAAGGCAASEYGDIFDIMGNGGQTPHYSAFQKERLGWLNAGISPPITTVPAVQGTSTYTIAPIEDARNSISRALKIPRSTSCGVSTDWLYVESRQAKGFDAFLAGNANIQSGVLVRNIVAGGADGSYLLDMTPATATWADAALVAGQTFTDPVSGVTIAPLSVTSTGSTVAVTFPPASCTRAAPTVTLNPTDTIYMSPGGNASYLVSVRNNDSCGCGASSFDLTATVPSGWSAQAVRTASMPPASAASANFIVTAAAAAPVAFYSVVVGAANSAAPATNGSVASTVAIVNAFGVSVTTDKATYALPTKGKRTSPANITTKVQNGSTPVTGASVTVAITDPAGTVWRLSGTTDASGTAKVSYALSRTAPKGTYRLTSTATQGAVSNSASASFVAQ